MRDLAGKAADYFEILRESFCPCFRGRCLTPHLFEVWDGTPCDELKLSEMAPPTIWYSKLSGRSLSCQLALHENRLQDGLDWLIPEIGLPRWCNRALGQEGFCMAGS